MKKVNSYLVVLLFGIFLLGCSQSSNDSPLEFHSMVITELHIDFDGADVEENYAYSIPAGFRLDDYGHPMGFAYQNGEVLNQFIDSDFGLLIIHENGRIELSHGSEWDSVEKVRMIKAESISAIQLQSVIRGEKVSPVKVDLSGPQHFIVEKDSVVSYIYFVDATLSSAVQQLNRREFDRVLRLNNDHQSPAIIYIN